MKFVKTAKAMKPVVYGPPPYPEVVPNKDATIKPEKVSGTLVADAPGLGPWAFVMHDGAIVPLGSTAQQSASDLTDTWALDHKYNLIKAQVQDGTLSYAPAPPGPPGPPGPTGPMGTSGPPGKDGLNWYDDPDVKQPDMADFVPVYLDILKAFTMLGTHGIHVAEVGPVNGEDFVELKLQIGPPESCFNVLSALMMAFGNYK